MQKILTATEMREVDRITIEDLGIPSLVLMENAGTRVYRLLAHQFSPLEKQKVVILSGRGHNGGDGLVIARHMVKHGQGNVLQVVLLGDPQRLRGDVATNYVMLQTSGFQPTVAKTSSDWHQVRSSLLSATIVVDAILGTGLHGPVEGLYQEAIRDLNTSFPHAKVIAVDMPSGLPSDSGKPLGDSVHADHTVTFTAPKVSQIFPANCEHVGKLHVVPIGTTPSVMESNSQLKLSMVEADDIAPLFAPRNRFAHKGDFGHVLVVGGSRARPGAVLMAGTAALRAGAGLVTVATPTSAISTIVSSTPELMTEPGEESEDGSLTEFSYRKKWFDRATVVAVGPGLGTSRTSQNLVRRIVREIESPLVVDADGITALAGLGKQPWSAKSQLFVLTPHPGEMSRLTGLSIEEIEQHRVKVAREFAEERQVYLVLKGFRTVTATPDGRVFVNPTGTPAMASGGTGDILTGILSGFLAQFPKESPELLITAAIYLHGLAAEFATRETSELSMLATDILQHLPRAILSLKKI